METMAPKLVPQHPELCSLLIDQLLTLLPGEPNSLWLSYPAEAQAELEAQAEKKQVGVSLSLGGET